MSLTRTAPTITAGADVSAADHRELLLAFDELLEARFSGKSWLVFDVNPQLPVDNVCVFGTPDNINAGSYSAYDPADEDPPDPAMGNVLSTDTATKVIWLTGYSDTTTLNRRTVNYDAGSGTETWWVGTTRPQRFEPLGVADIIVEDYTDPTAGNNTTFTYLAHWDKYGCIRIHNGNRHALTVNFAGATQDAEVIPPYGILCGRRTNHDQPFVFESSYIHLTQEGDPIRWHKWIGEDFEGALFAGSFEFLDIQLRDLYQWCRINHELDNDSTSVEQGSFTGAAPTSSDKIWDWLWHPGKLLSVVLDKRDGTTTVTELEWAGVDSVPDATWSGHVDVTLDDALGKITFESAVTPPSGAADEEWTHDLIPATTNLTGGAILSLHPDPAELSPGPVAWGYYTTGEGVTASYSSLTTTATPTYYTTDSGSATTHAVATRELQGTTLPLVEFSSTITDAIPNLSTGTTTIQKCCSGIGKRNISSTSATFGMSYFPGVTLDQAYTSGSLLQWVTGLHYTITAARLRFTARQARKGHTADPSYNSHPQDRYVLGTPDGLGGPMEVQVEPIFTSPVAIEGVAWDRTATTQGSVMLTPTDLLHAVASRINEAGWWAANRDRVLAGTLDTDDESLCWRPPRLTEQFNAMSRCINLVQEVYPANVYHLHKDPLPSGCNEFPFSYVGEDPFCVPADWCIGRHDGDDSLKDWCDLWGVTYTEGLADLDALDAHEHRVWGTQNNGDNSAVANLAIIAVSSYDLVNTPDTVNGHTYYKYNFWSAAWSRRIFGGAGDWTDYVWVSHTDAESVFSSLGIPVPPVPAGERFTPTFEEDSGYTFLNGALGSSPTGSYTPRSRAQQVYRLADPDGTWIHVFYGGLGADGLMTRNDQFRLLANTSTTKPVFSWQNSGDTEYTTVQREHSSDCTNNSQLSPRQKTLLTASAIHVSAEGYMDIDSSAWRSGTEVYSDVPLLVVAAPEPWCLFVWNTFDFSVPFIPNPPEQQYSITVTTPSSGGLNHEEMPAGSVTPNALISAGWSSFAVYHCQVVQRYGVLRA